MASLYTDADSASRSSSSHPDAAHRRPAAADLVQLSAADCSIGDDSGAVAASSIALAEPATNSSSSQHLPPPPPPPPFEPLFALLTNTTTGATVHPRVHYLFADDDASLPTATQHRSLVVDLAPTPDHDAWAVSCASSLGSAFAVTAAALSKQQAESSSGSSAAEPTPAGGGAAAALMLHVVGVSRDPVDLRASAEGVGSAASLRSSSASAAGGEDLEALAEDFRRRMGVLKKVVGEGEKRRAVMAHHDREDDAAAGSHEIHDPGALRSGTASQSHDVAAAAAAASTS